MNIYIYIYIYIYKSQFDLSTRLQLYKTSFLIGYNSICKVDICYNKGLDSESLQVFIDGPSFKLPRVEECIMVKF